MKRIISLILALMLVASVSVTAFAAEEKGSITINGVSTENVYGIYKLLDLESYDKTAGAYSYKANSAWTVFFATAEAKAYFTTDDAGYVTWTWKATAGDPTTEEEAVTAFTKLALAYAKAQTPAIAPVKSSETAGDFVVTESTGKFSDLELGYYLIDSTMGALCGLTTTNPDASINAKNGAPTIDKQVNEDSTTQWGGTNTADIGQIVEFRVTINVHDGAENYVLHDAMCEGMNFEGISEITHVVPGSDTHTVPADKYTVKTGADVTDGCTFEIHFTQAFCDDLATNDKIIVSYTAILNRKAVISGTGNVNTAWLDFGEDHETAKDTTTTYTYSIDIVKTDSQNTLIDGAKFKIYDAATAGNEITVVPLLEADNVTPVLDENGNPVYRRASAAETGVEITVTDGILTIVGLDNGTYYLEETVAPEGYNKLTDRQRFIISDGNREAVFNNGIFSTGSGVHVVNKTGSMLPETGGLGTVLFITIGSILVLGAGVVLVTKKRMSMIQD